MGTDSERVAAGSGEHGPGLATKADGSCGGLHQVPGSVGGAQGRDARKSKEQWSELVRRSLAVVVLDLELAECCAAELEQTKL